MAITPYLLYEDVNGALNFLARAFGFRRYGAQMRGPDGKISHAAMKLGDDLIMMGRPAGSSYRNPKRLGQATQSLYINVDDVDKHLARARKAGAAIIHLHARDPQTGEPTPDPAVFMRFLPVIKQSTDAVVNITTGGGLNMTLDDRLEAPLLAKPEMCSLNMGSMNFNIARAGDRVKTWKHAWEKPYLDRTDDHIFRNTFRDVAGIVELLGKAHGTRFEFECYDVGHLYNLAYCLDQKIVEPPLFVQTIFGILGGIGADPRNLLFMKETADKLFGDAYVWSVLAAGRHQMAFTTMAGILGGNVRVGLEDSLYIGRGALAKSNAEQVAKIRRILEELSLEIATPTEAREVLKLKGGDRVGF